MLPLFGNRTYPAHWRPEPDFRGTYSILSSCVFTIGLCLWSALHLNIQEQDSGWNLRTRTRKARWLLCALLAPELVAYTAVRQYVHAKSISRFMEKHWSPEKSPPKRSVFRKIFPGRKSDLQEAYELASPLGVTSESRRSPWTLTHSFYVIMGGFVFDVSSSPINFLPQHRGPQTKARTQVVFTPKGFKRLVEHHFEVIPDISKEQILDKSKADGFAKLIVCIQALWFCIQCIFRMSRNLSISLLELNTFAHAICALLIYVFWWEKPFDVSVPTSLVHESIFSIVALQSMATFPMEQRNCFCHNQWVNINSKSREIGFYRHPKVQNSNVPGDIGTFIGKHNKKVINILPTHSDMNITNPMPLIKSQAPIMQGVRTKMAKRPMPFRLRVKDFFWPSVEGPEARHLKFISRKFDSPVLRLYENHSLYGFSLVNLSSKAYMMDIEDCGISSVPRSHVDLSRGDVRRMELAAEAINSLYPQKQNDELLQSHMGDTLCDRISDVPGDDFMQLSSSDETPGVDPSDRLLKPRYIWTWLGLSFASALYGLLHLLAYDAPFATNFERTCWRISAITLMSGGFLFGPLYVIPKSVELRNNRNISEVVYVFIPTFTVFAGIFYVAARGFVIVESFVNLVHLPPSAFVLPNWSPYFPHIL